MRNLVIIEIFVPLHARCPLYDLMGNCIVSNVYPHICVVHEFYVKIYVQFRFTRVGSILANVHNLIVKDSIL